MRVRLKDVAERAGVSITTVSHVLSGYTKSGIKRDTRERVQKIAQEMGYRAPSTRAVKGNTQTIGFYTGYGYRDPRDPFMAEMYSGMMHGCDEFGLDFLIHGDVNGRDPEEVQAKLSDGRIDGLVVHAPPDDPVVARLAASRLPVVAIADEQVSLPSVVANDGMGIEMLVDYLWKRGHRKYIFFQGLHSLESVVARSNSFEKLVHARGGDAKVCTMPYNNSGPFLHAWQNEPDHATAFCCWNDRAAYLLVRVALEMGISMPDSLAICGFDGLLDDRLPAKQLVTIRVPWRKMAVEAVKMLVGPARDRTVWAATRFPVEFVPGDTA